MQTDIKDKKDIEVLINTFYEKVNSNSPISHFFTDVVKVNWEKHLPIMYDFWENVIFNSGNYSGNPMEKHKAIHSKSPFTMGDFQVWTSLFTETVDELFKGEKAELIKQRAMSIATVMQINIFK